MNHTAFVPLVNEILSGTKTKDPTNDYYPDKLYVDTETGTFGGCAGLVIFDTFDWDADDIDAFEEMTDRERRHYVEHCAEVAGTLTPAAWINGETLR